MDFTRRQAMGLILGATSLPPIPSSLLKADTIPNVVAVIEKANDGCWWGFNPISFKWAKIVTEGLEIVYHEKHSDEQLPNHLKPDYWQRIHPFKDPSVTGYELSYTSGHPRGIWMGMVGSRKWLFDILRRPT